MRQTIAYFTGLDERSGALAGDASAALTAKNVVTDHGRLALSLIHISEPTRH